MAIALKTSNCPCCSEKLNITILLKEGDCTDAWLSPKRSASIDSWYDDAYLYDDDPYEDRYDPYEDSICYFCNGNCYGRCDYEAEMDATYLEAEQLEAAEFLNFTNGSSKAKRYDRRKKQSQKLARKRPPATRSWKPSKLDAYLAKIQPGFRFAIEVPHNRFPKVAS